MGHELGVDFSRTYSCYKGGPGPLRRLLHLRGAPGSLQGSRNPGPDGLCACGAATKYRGLNIKGKFPASGQWNTPIH